MLGGLLRSTSSRVYERRLSRAVRAGGAVPRHVGLIMDGNRRWARRNGWDDPSSGHRAGAEHVHTVLGWCHELGIDHITIYLASVDNLRKRDSDEVAQLLALVETVVVENLMGPDPVWRVHIAGRRDALPSSTSRALASAEEHTRARGLGSHLTIAIGYDGRIEIVDAVREWLRDQAQEGATARTAAERVSIDEIGARVSTSLGPSPDLIIRTSGERRTSGFLSWASPRAELHFCDRYWPGLRRIDLLLVIHSYQQRRAGGGIRTRSGPVATGRGWRRAPGAGPRRGT